MSPESRSASERNHSSNDTQFKIAFYRTPICMIMISSDGVIERANEACSKLFETGISQLCQIPVKDLVSHGLLPKELLLLCDSRVRHTTKTIEFKNRLGAKLWLQIQCISPRRLNAGTSKIIMIQNITDSVKAGLLASELSSRIIQAHEEEKQLLSQEIHDTICQSLAALKIVIQAGAPSDETIDQVNQLINQSRNLAHNLRPEIVGEQSLISALKSLIIDLRARFKKRITFKTNTNNINLPLTVSLQLYRIVQESIINAGKHANATTISVTIHKRGEYLTLLIVDNGKGFDVKKVIASAKTPSLGLKITKERTKKIGAEYHIRSDVGKGTQVKLTYRLPHIKPTAKNNDIV